MNSSQFESQQGLRIKVFIFCTPNAPELSEMKHTNWNTRPDLQFTPRGDHGGVVSLRSGRLCSSRTRLPVYYVDGSASRGQAGCGVYAGEAECYSFRCTGPVRFTI